MRRSGPALPFQSASAVVMLLLSAPKIIFHRAYTTNRTCDIHTVSALKIFFALALSICGKPKAELRTLSYFPPFVESYHYSAIFQSGRAAVCCLPALTDTNVFPSHHKGRCEVSSRLGPFFFLKKKKETKKKPTTTTFCWICRKSLVAPA